MPTEMLLEGQGSSPSAHDCAFPIEFLEQAPQTLEFFLVNEIGPSAYEEPSLSALPSSALQKELYDRFVEFGALRAGWDGPSSIRPSRDTLIEMLTVGARVIRGMGDRLQTLNLLASGTGQVSFTLFGSEGREVELWIGERPGRVTFLASQAEEEFEGSVRNVDVDPVLFWLKGEGPLPS